MFSSLLKRFCPVCQSQDDAPIIFKENICLDKINKLTFSSRKIPELMNYCLVQCQLCDLLYANKIPSKNFLQKAYQQTDYKDEEAIFAAETYKKWLNKILEYLPDRTNALDIGAGNGIFISKLIEANFTGVKGIEPSSVAVANAPLTIRPYIQEGVFDINKFPKNHFSLITIFQTLEHIDEPGKFFKDAYALLKPGGILLIISHNYRHWLMRLLGKYSPIIDVEHLQLFSPKSLNFALNASGFRNIQMRAIFNSYPIYYWIKLFPMPLLFKKFFLHILKNKFGSKISSLKISMSVGNMVAWATK